MEGVLAVIWMFGGNFAPRSWTLCQGQLLAIAQNQALFSLLGTFYGGDGSTTFALPDLRSRVPMGAGSGAGLTPRSQGQRFGTEQNILTTQQMPSHNHGTSIAVNAAPGGESTPSEQVIAAHAGAFSEEGTPGQLLGGVTDNNVGGNLAVNNIQPSMVVNFVICLQGLFPSRN